MLVVDNVDGAVFALLDLPLLGHVAENLGGAFVLADFLGEAHKLLLELPDMSVLVLE